MCVIRKSIARACISLCLCIANSVSAQELRANNVLDQNPIEPYKKNYLAFPFKANSDGDNEARIQLSFLAMFKAHEYEVGEKLFGFTLETRKVLNLGFTYTQHFYNNVADSSYPVVSTDYMPGLFISLHDRDTKDSL